MTLNPPAEPRPPPPRRPPEVHRPSFDRSSTKVIPPHDRRVLGLQRHIVQPGDDRPAKRRKVEGDGFTGQTSSTGDGSPTSQSPELAPTTKGYNLRLLKPSTLDLGGPRRDDQTEEAKCVDAELPDLPTRPWHHAQSSKVTEDPKPTHRLRVKIPVPTTPDSLQIPSSAPYIVPKKPAGFFPWTGKHPEDVLNDVNVKQGFFDKPPNPLDKELNTARVPLYNALKHKSGVENLSILFSLILDQKNQHGLISSASTFRPPPRVTLTEAKRKSWIADLANAEVPLRRLSRTIPQGIRGQVLLDLCLRSCVPLNRAIWFVKCVCANEIRTLKRKGTTPAVAVGAESKWLREWTVSVEQFIEAHLGRAKQQDWRAEMQYALRLTTRLYMENLLDRDHYLDWIVRSFHTTDLPHVPFWLMVIHILKDDLSHYRRRGKRLAEVLIEKFRLASRYTDQSTSSVRQKLYHMIRWLLLSRPMNFVMPETWPEVVESVRTCLDNSVQQERYILDQLNRVNARAMGHNKEAFTAQRTAHQVIVEILDAAQAPYDLPRLAENLDAACADSPLLISTCLEWACTRFRQSKARPYLFARLARRWQRAGHDVDNIILNYFSSCRNGDTTAECNALQHLAAHLSRSGLFPLSKYMQWLMVRGLPKRGEMETLSHSIRRGAGPRTLGVDAASSQLLLHVSLHNVEPHVINLRSSILRGCGFDPEVEDDIFQDSIHFIEQKLRNLGYRPPSSHSSEREPAFGFLPWTIKSRLAMWLRRSVAETARVSMGAPGAPIGVPLLDSRIFNVEQFAFICNILECMEDVAVLADVIGILCGSQDDHLVASLVATIQFHADTFSAIGALEVLQRRICQIYMSWRNIRPTMPLLTSTLLDLCTTYPVTAPSTRLLQQDFVRGDRGRAVAACSPYSDGIAESLQQAGATFVEDFEAILQSEPNMNEQTMNGLFAVLADRIEKQQKFDHDTETVVSFCQLLSRLRLCRKGQGDFLLHRWITRLVPSVDAKYGSLLLQSLIGTGCMTFAGVFGADAVSNAKLRRSSAVRLLLEHINAPPQNLLADLIFYRTRSRWFEYVRREARAALELLCDLGLESALHSMQEILLACLVKDDTIRSSPMSDSAQQWLLKALDRLLSRQGDLSGSGDIKTLVSSINFFSHQFVQLSFWLTSRSRLENGVSPDEDELVRVLSEVIEQMLQNPAGNKEATMWFAKLLEAVEVDVGNRLRHQVENEFLDALPKFQFNKGTSPVTAMFSSDVHHLSSIMERAYLLCTESTSPTPGFMVQLIDKLSQHLKALGGNPSAVSVPASTGLSGSPMNMTHPQTMSVTSSPAATNSEGGHGVTPGLILGYLSHILEMICLQRRALATAGHTGTNLKQAQTEEVQLLVRLALIATHPAMTSAPTSLLSKEDQQKAKEVRDFTLDVIATIVDDVSDEARMMSAKFLKDKLQDGRMKYLFGSINVMGSAQVRDLGQGLQMVKEGKGVLGDWRPRVWEVLDNGSGKESEAPLGLGLFGARHTT
ncbi:hypothetical protein A1O1_03446 [Capronia coronata CBS 617.96]|uniref:Mediator of RNA polymerase II transcription subunit 12 n=1 Tax=Capronia coronata CBS 617.96 TaxID=1182541 RepID=W9YBX6_9EURO|nr:uncharacterized protein A1O1_03446 [Capronia coronata CBS 617.96]EXJ90347.1 hypothetical protein A1O1_03446 [Capronia coronata CBS 617.96]